VTVSKPQDTASEAPRETFSGSSQTAAARAGQPRPGTTTPPGGTTRTRWPWRTSRLTGTFRRRARAVRLAWLAASGRVGGQPWLTSASGPAEAAKPPRCALPADALKRLARRVVPGPSASPPQGRRASRSPPSSSPGVTPDELDSSRRASSRMSSPSRDAAPPRLRWHAQRPADRFLLGQGRPHRRRRPRLGLATGDPHPGGFRFEESRCPHSWPRLSVRPRLSRPARRGAGPLGSLTGVGCCEARPGSARPDPDEILFDAEQPR
jgi:hypothetical protein